MPVQFPPAGATQGVRYLQHQQAQQMMPPSLAAARSSMLYGQQQPLTALQQQSMHCQLGMSSGANSLHLLHGETGVGGNGALAAGSFPDFGRNNGDSLQAATRGLMGGGKQESGNGGSDGRGGQTADGTEALYLKGAEGN